MTKSLLLSYVSLEPKRQGHASYTHVQEIIDGLRKRGWQVDLYAPQYGGKSLPGALARLGAIAQVAWRAIAGPRGDVFYMRWHFAAFPVALYARLKGLPTVIEVNGPVEDLFIAWPKANVLRGVFTWLMESQLRWAGGIVAVTDGLKHLSESIVGDAKDVVTIANGANTDHFTPAAAQTDNDYTRDLPEKFMIFFGTMAPWQGIGTILRAAEDPAWPSDVHVVFAGDGAERPKVEEAAKRLGHVRYLGRLPYDALPGVTARALGAFVCTENLEGRGTTGLAPLKLFESLASGLPVIATDMPFQADVVRTGACGYVVPPGDSNALARTVAELAGDPTHRQEMGQNARDIAVREHSWAARARDTHDLLVRVLEQNREPI